MRYRFRDWQVYKDARMFRLHVLQEVVPQFPQAEKFEHASQLRRSLTSTILNIAEGSFRLSDKDFAHFINQSQSSLYEVVACLEIAADSRYIDKRLLDKYITQADVLASQLAGFAKHLRKQ